MEQPARVVPDVGVAAADHLRPVLLGPPVTAEVISSGPFAAYLRVGTRPTSADSPASVRHGSRQVIALVARCALVPPSALVLPDDLRPEQLLRPGDRVVVGRGALVVPARPLRLRPVRWFSPAHVRAGVPLRARAAVLADKLAALPRPSRDVAAARSQARAAAGALLAERPFEAGGLLVQRLGLGPGTTPSGDDVAAGVLLAARAVLAPGSRGAVALERVATRVSLAAASRTTCVSAALLSDAARGLCAAPVARAIAVLAPRSGPCVEGGDDRNDDRTVERTVEPTVAAEGVEGLGPADSRALDELLRLGNTSGADLATGLLAVLLEFDSSSRHHPTRRSA